MRQITLLAMCGLFSSCWWISQPAKTFDEAPIPPCNPPVVSFSEIPVAQPVPGRDGFVFSPFGNRLVDCQGMASGTLVYDPYDTEEPRKRFRVP